MLQGLWRQKRKEVGHMSPGKERGAPRRQLEELSFYCGNEIWHHVDST